MILQPRVLSTTPAQVLLHDPMHDRWVDMLELEGHRESNVSLLVQCAGVVAEVHVFAVDGSPITDVREKLGRFEYLRDEHRSFPSRGWRKKVEILPDSPPYRARDSDVVLQPGQSALDRLGYEFRHYGTALDPESTILGEPEVTRCVSDDQASESFVAYQDVGAKPEHEVLDAEFTRR